MPQAEHVVRVSARTRPPLARFALHCLQCLGSFLNCLSWKKSCSPAVNTNSAPQSLHFSTLSINSMAVFPKNRDLKSEIGHDHESLPVPSPCLHTSVKTNENPGRTKSSGNLDASVDRRQNYLRLRTPTSRSNLSETTATCRPIHSICMAFRAGEAVEPERHIWRCVLKDFSPALCEPSCDSACVPVLLSRGAFHRASDSRNDASLP
jgi:hypothetical protein